VRPLSVATARSLCNVLHRQGSHPVLGLVCRGILVAMSLKSYRLRNPADHHEVYGDGIDDEAAAWQRAATLADFYRHPVEVCVVVSGIMAKPVGEPVEPGPTAPRARFNGG